MDRDDAIYDLGEVELDEPKPVFAAVPAAPRPAPFRREPRPPPAGVGPALASSLSMFVPGLGLLITGDIAWGLFYLSGTGFCAATLWALLMTIDRLVPTLRLLELPPDVLVIALTALALVAVVLHLAAVLHAQSQSTSPRAQAAPHPIVAGLASLLIPGWGQLLASHRRRAALFLGSVWLLSLAWILVTPAGTGVLSRLSLALPASIRDGWGPVLMLSAPIVLWIIAVYDAASGAAAERNR